VQETGPVWACPPLKLQHRSCHEGWDGRCTPQCTHQATHNSCVPQKAAAGRCTKNNMLVNSVGSQPRVQDWVACKTV
jgi:hypothetical protein